MKARSGLLLALGIVIACQLNLAQEEEVQDPSELWPKTIELNRARLTVYQPQVDEWDMAAGKLKAAAAVAVRPEGETKDSFGAVRFTARTDLDPESRTVAVTDMKLVDVLFPSLEGDLKGRVERVVKFTLPLRDKVVLEMDYLLASENKAGFRRHQLDEKHVPPPPPILYSESPALLVVIDGEPALQKLGDSGLEWVANTNWDLLKRGTTWYLRNEDVWLAAPQLDGVWTGADLPPEFQKIPATPDWEAVKKAVPGARIDPKAVPRVIVSHRPAELILVEGEPQMKTIGGTGLTYVENTKGDLFFHAGETSWYYQVTGRWFRTSAKPAEGKWESVAPSALPPDFAKIPPDHSHSRCLVSVPGTPEAERALTLTEVPQVAVISKKNPPAAPDVRYAGGQPNWVEIEGSKVRYASNCGYSVFAVGDAYYLCYEGVWFQSAAPGGPWSLCTRVPEEIYSIPGSCPLYNTTYVYVYDDSEDELVVGYTSGYYGVYGWCGVVVYGTGWYYPPYWYGGIYYPYPHTYGCGAYYNWNTGTYGRYGYCYGPYGGVGRAAVYNPSTGVYGRGVTAWGPNGSFWAAEAYDPRSGTYAATRQSASPYASWGQSVVRRGDDWVRTGHYSDARGTAAGWRTSQGGKGVIGKGADGSTGGIAKTGDGDLYVGRDGEIYRRTEDGWQKRNGDSWDSVKDKALEDRRTGARKNEDFDRERTYERERAAERARDREAGDRSAKDRSADRASTYRDLNRESQRRYDSSRMSGAYRSTRSYGGGGGGRRGGGGGRRGG